MDFIKTFLIPGGKWFVVLGFSAGVLMLYGPPPLIRWARRWLTTLAVLYWVLTLPVIADRLAAPLSGTNGHKPQLDDISGAAAIVVLGAGAESYSADGQSVTLPAEQTALNAFEAVAVYRVRPRPVI